MMRGYGYSNGVGAMGGYSPFADLLMIVFWLLLFAGAVILIVWAVRQTMHHGTTTIPGTTASPSTQQHDEAMAIARKRLASGEITREQFEDIRQALGG